MAEHTSLKVWLVPPLNRGGLQEQFEQTAAALAQLGVSVHVGDASAAAPNEIVHLFDAPAIFETLQQFLTARAQGARIVVNPVYWNATRFFQQGLAGIDEPRGAQADLEERIRHVQRQAEYAARKLIFCHADALLPLSPSEAALVAHDFDAPRDRMIIAPNGIGSVFAQPHSGDSFAQKYGVRDFILCAGRLDAVKNQLALLRALRDESVALVLIGKAETPEYLDLCQRQAQLSQGRVLFVPSLPREELAAAYAAARVHALVSWFDVAPLAALEAAASGCRVVLTSESGGRDYFGDDAWYCDPGDDLSIRHAVCAAYAAPANPALRERVVREFTWTHAAEQTKRAYELAQDAPRAEPDDYLAQAQSALAELAELAVLQDESRAQLWQEKESLARERDAYANGRVINTLNALNRVLKR